MADPSPLASPAQAKPATPRAAALAEALDGKSKTFTSLMWCILFPGVLIVFLYFVQMWVGFVAASRVAAAGAQYMELSKCCSAVAVFALLMDIVLVVLFAPYIKNFWRHCAGIKRLVQMIGCGLGAFFFVGYLISNIYQCAVVFGQQGKDLLVYATSINNFAMYQDAASCGNIFITMIVFIILAPVCFFVYRAVPLFHGLMTRWTTVVKAKIAPPTPPTTKNPAGPAASAAAAGAGNPFVSV